MGAYQIIGGRPLEGAVQIHGAKNSVLPVLAATIVGGGEYTIHNCPEISDVDTALDILRVLGCTAERDGARVCVDTSAAENREIPEELMKKMRAAILFLGALLARFGTATISAPGGCVLGERPINLHLLGLRLMGADYEYDRETLRCRASTLRGCTVALPFPSVGATENLILAALACEGEVTICNAAKEPEIADLIGFLRACGAKIAGTGTSVLQIVGGAALHGTEYGVMPDRMEAATYLAAAAATRGRLVLQGANPAHLQAVIEILERGGCEIAQQQDEIIVRCDRLRAVSPIVTAPYDGFPTDAQAPVMAAMATAEGVSVFEETIFSDRFRHVPALRAMGARIYATERHAVVTGVRRLHGASVEATDLRGGAAMVIAALSAEGESRITKTEHMERGYASFAQALRSCGAQIESI
ncbi:MAG: UDP-N-acetylglucosamine 1-carboxyvinyltransferase [Oscillospiraceae bacterium]|nr:UDP-N-acetylglucosamine 1-carboxyvinyltransferase [Oscillospiraceae bacterium]